jgi:hypothetical protein
MQNAIPIPALLLLMVSTALADAVVTVVPGLIGRTGSFTASVDISGVSNLSAFQFDRIYSARIIQATSVAEGDFLSQGGSTIFLSGTIDNRAGSISFIGGALLGGSGVSGSGSR